MFQAVDPGRCRTYFSQHNAGSTHSQSFISLSLVLLQTVLWFLERLYQFLMSHYQGMWSHVHIHPWPYSPFQALASLIRCLHSSLFAALLFHLKHLWGFLNISFFPGWGHHPHAQPPTWRTRMSLFVWVITFDLSGLGDPASSYATAGLAFKVIWPHKPPPLCQSGDTFGVNPCIQSPIILSSGACAKSHLASGWLRVHNL